MNDIDVHHLARGVAAASGASRGHDLDRVTGGEGGDRRLQGPLDACLAALTLPATKSGALVLDAESDPADLLGHHGRGLRIDMVGWDCRWDRQGRDGQTSSMIAISALSPRRGTVRMMRV